MPVNGMKPTDIVRLLNDGTGTVVFKLIPARIPTIIESGEKRYLQALVVVNNICTVLRFVFSY